MYIRYKELNHIFVKKKTYFLGKCNYFCSFVFDVTFLLGLQANSQARHTHLLLSGFNVAKYFFSGL